MCLKFPHMVINNKLQQKRLPGFELMENHYGAYSIHNHSAIVKSSLLQTTTYSMNIYVGNL